MKSASKHTTKPRVEPHPTVYAKAGYQKTCMGNCYTLVGQQLTCASNYSKYTMARKHTEARISIEDDRSCISFLYGDVTCVHNSVSWYIIVTTANTWRSCQQELIKHQAWATHWFVAGLTATEKLLNVEAEQLESRDCHVLFWQVCQTYARTCMCLYVCVCKTGPMDLVL